MEVQLIRYCYGPDHTAGLLKFGGNLQYSLWTLECPWQNNQIFVSCIPDGSYPLQGFNSADHPDTWVITPVPGRTGILVHVGNKVEDTQGCILVGQTQEPGRVWQSKDALRMMNYVLDRKAQHTITIGSGMGAQLVPVQPPDSLPSGSDQGNGNGGVPQGGLDTPGGAG